MDYKALYQSKLTTPEEAVKCVKSVQTAILRQERGRESMEDS